MWSAREEKGDKGSINKKCEGKGRKERNHEHNNHQRGVVAGSNYYPEIKLSRWISLFRFALFVHLAGIRNRYTVPKKKL